MQKKLLAAIAASVLLAGCGMFGEKADETKGWSAPKLYKEAREEMDAKNFERAVSLFEKLESSYPFGVYAQQAQMEIAYGKYKQGDQAEALAAVERFIKLHPNHPNVDYMYYLRGLINFNDQIGLLGFLYEQDLTERDPKATREAFVAFKQLVDKFPNSPYAADSVARMKYLVNAMASYEVHVAKYYYRRGAFVAALNRAQGAVADYRDAPAIEDALWMMAKCYDKMGMNDLRDDTMRVFQRSFPNSKLPYAKPEKPWYKFWN
ncbi:outer membrane protein assembly factor BamD [Massilia sp. TS11]|uniref:outer membrane protein assembly factor BamD n=1 Tax=Massilia sp. TS11 TaxID=2908003 RepID=UPI001EDB8381|nr:outer membrane protein assembly factor BamD [Massilia sp. TS11]MCG2584566.1 outer membrane protein assembly factor BamD [Massilia sp. TS11]